MTTDLRPTAELREIGDEIWWRTETTGNAWVRVPVDALAQVAVYVEAVAA